MSLRRGLLLSAIAITQYCFSQRTFIAGANASIRFPFIINQNVYGATELDYKLVITAGGGIKAGVLLYRKRLGLIMEVNYGRYGQKYDGNDVVDGSMVRIKREVKFTYLEVPVYARITRFFKNSSKSVYFEGGPQLMFMTDVSVKRSTDGRSLPAFAPAQEPANQEDAFNKFDAGLCLGLGLLKRTKWEDMQFSGGLRLYLGLIDVNHSSYQLPNDKGSYNASRNFLAAFQFSWEYFFNRKPGRGK